MSLFISTSPITQSHNIGDTLPDTSTAIEDKIRDLFSHYASSASNEKNAIFNQANNFDATNPAELIRLQERVANYSHVITTISALTHKSVSAIDAVLKAQ